MTRWQQRTIENTSSYCCHLFAWQSQIEFTITILKKGKEKFLHNSTRNGSIFLTNRGQKEQTDVGGKVQWKRASAWQEEEGIRAMPGMCMDSLPKDRLTNASHLYQHCWCLVCTSHFKKSDWQLDIVIIFPSHMKGGSICSISFSDQKTVLTSHKYRRCLGQFLDLSWKIKINVFFFHTHVK